MIMKIETKLTNCDGYTNDAILLDEYPIFIETTFNGYLSMSLESYVINYIGGANIIEKEKDDFSNIWAIQSENNCLDDDNVVKFTIGNKIFFGFSEPIVDTGQVLFFCYPVNDFGELVKLPDTRMNLRDFLNEEYSWS